jgi:hypothetical protein
MDHDAEAFDKWLTGEKKSARKNIRKVEAASRIMVSAYVEAIGAQRGAALCVCR